MLRLNSVQFCSRIQTRVWSTDTSSQFSENTSCLCPVADRNLMRNTKKCVSNIVKLVFGFCLRHLISSTHKGQFTCREGCDSACENTVWCLLSLLRFCQVWENVTAWAWRQKRQNVCIRKFYKRCHWVALWKVWDPFFCASSILGTKIEDTAATLILTTVFCKCVSCKSTNFVQVHKSLEHPIKGLFKPIPSPWVYKQLS